MRRLASVFAASRRSDKSEPSSPPAVGLARKKSGVFPSLPRKQASLETDPPPLPPLVASNLVSSPSSSSSGSTTIRTPDDDGLPRTPSKKGSWKSWLGGRNAPASDPEEHHPPAWQSSRNVPSPPKHATDDASSLSDDQYPAGSLSPLPSPHQMATAHANTRAMILNSLVRQPTLSPLLHSPGAISFPRSCHRSRQLRRRETLESELHKKSLLARLDRLSPSEESSVAHLALKQLPPKPQGHGEFEDDVFPSAGAVSHRCTGLESWVSRPYFEDRLQLWTRSSSGDVLRTRVPGSHSGVAALEFSESLELLAGTLPESDDVDLQADIAPGPVPEFTALALALGLDPPARAQESVSQSPSPQLGPPRADGGPTEQRSLDAPSLARQPGAPTPSGSAVANGPIPKRGVRFADDDGKDDQIPLGYVLRIRKNKEQKARFLREERERRERAAQLSVENRRSVSPQQENRVPKPVTPRRPPPRPLVSLHEPLKPQKPTTVSHVVREEERLRREVEKIEMEKLRRSRELARKQAEERERAYMVELQATRARREASRVGRPLESASPSLRTSDRSRTTSRDSMYATLRRSSVSHNHTPEFLFTPVPPYEVSPSSSVPATPGSQYSLSRPPSIYSSHTTSSEDIRGRDGRHIHRRMSVVPDLAKGVSLHPPNDPRASFNPYAWTNVPPVPPIPTVPMMNGIPLYGMDAPLLPPTPPFMMHEFGARTRSYTGPAGQHSPFQGSTSVPRNASSEGVNSGSRNSSPHSSGSHQRHSSDDATRTARALGDPRSDNYNSVRGSKTSMSIRGVASQSSPQRPSWPPEQSLTKKSSSLRPMSDSYSPGTPAHLRRRTVVS